MLKSNFAKATQFSSLSQIPNPKALFQILRLDSFEKAMGVLVQTCIFGRLETPRLEEKEIIAPFPLTTRRNDEKLQLWTSQIQCQMDVQDIMGGIISKRGVKRQQLWCGLPPSQ